MRTVELDVTITTTSVEDLHADFALGEPRCVHAYDSEHALDDLPAHNGRLWETSAHDEHIAAQALLAKYVLRVPDEVTADWLVSKSIS